MCGSTATFLFNMGRKSEGLCTAARILTLVAAILELRLLRMITTVIQLGAHKLGLAYGTLKGYKTRPNLPIDVFPLDVLLVVHVLNEAI